MRTASLLRMAVVLTLPILVLAHDQQARTFTWSSTNCSDGAEAAWTGCKMVHSGERLSEPGLVFQDGLFVEEMDGPNADVAVTVTKLKSNFLIHVGFKAVTTDHSYTIVPADAVKVISTSVIRPTTPKDVPENLEVVKLRFKENEPITVGIDLWADQQWVEGTPIHSGVLEAFVRGDGRGCQASRDDDCGGRRDSTVCERKNRLNEFGSRRVLSAVG